MVRTMKCNNCGTEYGLEFVYCPKCGKKAINIRREKKNLDNVDFLKFATNEELKIIHSEIKGMKFEDFKAWVSDKHSNVYIYRCYVGFCGDYKTNRSFSYHLHFLPCEKMVDQIEERIKDGRDKLVRFSPQEYKLLRTTPIDEEGVTWWRTKDECSAVMKKMQEELEGRGISL